VGDAAENEALARADFARFLKARALGSASEDVRAQVWDAFR
jgi:hypothetical protein